MKEELRYEINKGVNREIEFRGLRGQYIYFLAIGLAVLLVLFALLFIAGVPGLPLLAGVLLAGGGLFGLVFRLNRRYGAHGLMKAMARRQVPTAIISRSRKPLLTLGDDKSKSRP